MLEVLLCTLLIATCLQVSLLGWVLYTFMRIRARLRSLLQLALSRLRSLLQLVLLILNIISLSIMDCDELIDKLLSDEACSSSVPGSLSVPGSTSGQDSAVAQKRERLAAVVAGGQAERYLGRAISLDQIDKLTHSEIVKLYARYEMVFGASIAKTLGHYVLAMYSDLAAYYRPKINPNSLTVDLEFNPLVEMALSTYSGSLYHRFGMLLAPIAVAFTTLKHCRFGEVEDAGRAGSVGTSGNGPGDAEG
jgi:hypothetical protein